jgi:tetratricopeptide (TPR) repeat protein
MSAERPQKVFISRTSKGLIGIAEKVAAVLKKRGMEVTIQTEFLPHSASVRQMLQDRLRDCDAAICLIGPAHGGEPDDAISGLRDQRTEGKRFSFTQLEFLVARDLPRPVFTFVVSGSDIVEAYDTEASELAARQQQFITDFAKDGRTLYYDYTDAAKLLDEISEMEIPRTALAGKPANLPYASLGTLFKGRDEFLEQLRVQLTSDAATIIKGHSTIHGMGGVGKTRAAIEYAWRNADKYNALLFVSADSPQALQRNLANLCGPLVLNLPEQNEKDQNLQVEAALTWLALHPGWFLIIDNVDTEDAALETKALLERLSAGHVVITSRISEWKGEVKALDLDVLSDAASIEFLNERTADRRAQQPDDDATVARLVRVLDCLALALEQAGALISHERLSYARYLEMWESARPTALAWHDEEKMKYPRSLAVTYETSVTQLSSAAQEFFRELSWLAPDPLPRSTLDALPDPADARRRLSELDHLHLVRFQQDGKSFAVHRLVQEITRQKQGTVSTPAPDQERVEKPRSYFSRLFGSKERPPIPISATPAPSALISSLKWIDRLFTGNPNDVRIWSVLDPLASHAKAVAAYADADAVSDPTARLMNDVALLLKAKAQHSAAEPLVRRALAIDEASYGKEHPYVARDLNNLAGLLKATNRMAEAEPLMRRALAIGEASYGKEHPDVATHLSELASLLQDTNRMAEAEPLMRRALAIDEASYGNDHPDVAIRLSDLAGLLRATNRLGEAEPLMRRALAIDEASDDKEIPAVAVRLNNLAGLLKATNRLAEAEPLMWRALSIDEAAYGKEHPKVAIRLNNLAGLLRATNRLTDAEPLMWRALSIDEAAYGKEHPKVAIRLNNLAGLLQATNRLTEAEPLMRRALAIDETSYGKEHPDVAICLNNLAGLLQDTNRLAEAEPLMRRMVLIFLRFTQQTGHPHPLLVGALDNYAGLVQAWKGDRAMVSSLHSLGAEAGIPEAQFQEILAQAFGE